MAISNTFVFLFVFATSLATGDPIEKIVGGIVVSPERYENTVLLMTFTVPGHGQATCTATSIAPRFALSSLHCVKTLGIYHTNVVVGGLTGWKYHEHPQADLVILEMDRNVFQNFALLSSTDLRDRIDGAELSGYGRFNDDIPSDKKLRFTRVPVFKTGTICPRLDVYCTSNATNRAARGDSGGPMWCYTPLARFQIGICITGVHKLGTNYYYATSEYCAWIKNESDVDCVAIELTGPVNCLPKT